MQKLPLERLRLDNLGGYLHLAMKLERIPSEDIAAVAALVNHSYTRSSVYVLVFGRESSFNFGNAFSKSEPDSARFCATILPTSRGTTHANNALHPSAYFLQYRTASPVMCAALVDRNRRSPYSRYSRQRLPFHRNIWPTAEMRVLYRFR
jgi:hypothetical protein